MSLSRGGVMQEQILRSKRRRLYAAGLLVFSLACADGGGDCGGDGGGCGEGGCGLGGEYTTDGHLINQSMQIHVSPEGFEFIGQNAGAVVGELLGGGLSFCVPPTAGLCYVNTDPACPDAQDGCLFQPDIREILFDPEGTVTAESPEEEHSVLHLGVVMDLEVQFPINWGLFVCEELYMVSTDAGWRLDVDIVFDVGEPIEELTSFELELAALNLRQVRFEGRNDANSDCDALAGIWNVITDTGDALEGVIAPIIEPLITDQLAGALPEALGLAGQFDLSAAMAAFNPNVEHPLWYSLFLANYVSGDLRTGATGRGLSIAMQTGFHAVRDDCVPYVWSGLPVVLPTNDDLNGGQEVSDRAKIPRVPKSLELINYALLSSPYHMAIGIHESMLELALWAVYNSGALCISVGTDTIEQLSSAALAIVLDSLTELTHNRNVPMLLQMQPSGPPTISLGEGTVTGDGTIVDPLMILELDDLDLHFYFFIEERMTLVFTLNVDIRLPLALSPGQLDDGSTGIRILLGDLGDAFTRIESQNSELLDADDVAELSEVLPALLGLIGPLFLESLAAPIAIPDFFGFRLALTQESFTSVDGQTMLALYANLETVESGMVAAQTRTQAIADLISVNGPSAEDITRFEGQVRRGNVADYSVLDTEVVLAVETLDPVGYSADFEYTYRIDGGPWRFYQRPADGQLHISDSSFRLEGWHSIEVESRAIGSTAATNSLASEAVEFVVDLATPNVTMTRNPITHQIDLDAWDSVWGREALSMRYQIDGGVWSDFGEVRSITLPTTHHPRTVSLLVEVLDHAERSTMVQNSFALLVIDLPSDVSGPAGSGPLTDLAPEPEGGCSTVGANGSSGNTLLWMLAVVGAVVGLRRRRGWLAMLAVLGLLAIGCGDDPPVNSNPTPTEDMGGLDETGFDTGAVCDPACGPLELCENGICVDLVCSMDEECPQGYVCVGDMCLMRTSCTDDSMCPENQWCIDDDGDGNSECLTMPCTGSPDCAGLSCRNGGVPFCMGDFCACQIPCAEGCGDDQFCCRPQNMCLDLPDECAALDCPTGQGATITTPAMGDPDSCSVTGPDCACEDLPPLPLGDIGAFLGAAPAANGTIYIAAYNWTYGDLMVGEVQGDDSVNWEFVDGAPTEGEVTGYLEGPRGGISSPGLNVGKYTDIVVDSNGVLHVSYYNVTEQTLLYARGQFGGAWKFDVVDAAYGSGMYTSITLDANDVPGIAYLATRIESETSTEELAAWDAVVRYAWADANDPAGWTIEAVNTALNPGPCGGICFGAEQCVTGTNRCLESLRSSLCNPSCATGEACFNINGAVCAAVASFPTLYRLPQLPGLFIDSDRLGDDDVVVVFYDNLGHQLIYNTSEGGTFVGTTPVETAGPEGADLGWYPSVTVDGGDVLHFTYTDRATGDLMYFSSAATDPVSVDPARRGSFNDPDSYSFFINDSSVVVRESGALHFAYMDSTNHWVMTKTGAVGGVAGPVLGNEDPYEGAMGWYVGQFELNGQIVLVTYRINTQTAERDVVIDRLP